MSVSNGHDHTNVASLEEARKRAAAKAKGRKSAAQPDGPATARDWVIGGVIIAMALGFIATLVMRTAHMFGGGA
jgi:hypothetical protein